MDASVDAPSATTGATAEEEDKVEDAGTTAAPVRSGATGLARTTGRTSLARLAGEISLVKIAHTATQAFLLWRHHQGGTKNNIKRRRLGASRSRAQSLASWVARGPQPHNASLSSLLAR